MDACQPTSEFQVAAASTQPDWPPAASHDHQTQAGNPAEQAQAPGAAGEAAADRDSLSGNEEEEDEFDAELGSWLAGRLQRMQPGAELTVGSVKVLGRLLDEITTRVLEEARRVNSGEAAGKEAAAPGVDAAAAGPSTSALAPPVAAAQQGGRRGKQQKMTSLTSLDISKALKRVLPGEPASNKLRPYLPTVTKQAWHLDKQSLKGVKKQKQAAADAAAEEAGAIGSRTKENEQQQQQSMGALP